MSIAIIENPDDITCTLKFTMTLKAWKEIRKTLRTNTAYNELQIINEIEDLTYKLENVLYSETD